MSVHALEEFVLTTITTQRRYRLVDPRTLDQDAQRYLADLLIGHLRDDRWELREGEELGIPRHPGERPSHRTHGKGFSDPPGSENIIVFTAPPLYEIDIPKHLVALEDDSYNFWCRLNRGGHLPRLDRLLHGLRGSARVFYPELSGYGTNKRLKLRRSKHVTREEGDAAISLLNACLVAVSVKDSS